MQLSPISLAITRLGRTAGFSPANLFAAGEQGAWYDASDLTTMFQDRAGTTPVTADGQTVGLILDKSKGLALGPELAPSISSSSWLFGSGVSKSGETLVFSSAGSNQSGYFLYNLDETKTYKVTFRIVSISSGSLSAVLGDATSPVRTSAGTYTFYGKPDTANYFQIQSKTAGTTAVVDNISVRELPGNHAVAPTDAARPLYKTDGTYHWLQFDGVDDSLSTSAIDFTSTDKMSVFSGVRKSSLTGTAIVAEISVAADSNNGAFALFAPRGITTGDYGFWSKGTTNSTAISGNDYGVPITNVLTGIGNIGGDSAILRVNGSQIVSSVTDQGTGNYGNYSMFIGRRANTLLTISGNIYSLIVRGALSTADEITATETWVNSKTGAF